MEQKILNYEHDLYMELNEAEELFGMFEEITEIIRCKWSTVYKLVKELGLEPIRDYAE